MPLKDINLFPGISLGQKVKWVSRLDSFWSNSEGHLLAFSNI